MTHKLTFSLAMALAAATLPAAATFAQTPATATTTAQSEDARLTAFLDAEFAAYVKTQPQLATRLGIKEGGDRWNDTSDEGARAEVEWRKASAARMRAAFDRAKLSPEAQVHFDIWALEAERAEVSLANRIYRPPFYSRLYSAHSQLPDFLINTHSVADVTDLKNYIARLKGLPGNRSVAQWLEFLRQEIEILRGLSPLQMREFLLDSEVRACKTDEIVFQKNSIGSSMFGIADGSVKVEINPKNKAITVPIGTGQIFGEVGLISGRRRGATIRAARDTIVVEISRNAALKLMSQVPSASREITRINTERTLLQIFKSGLAPVDLGQGPVHVQQAGAADQTLDRVAVIAAAQDAQNLVLDRVAGGKQAWPPSDGMAISLPWASRTRAETPKPVPGPSTAAVACGSPSTGPPSEASSASGTMGAPQARASKSLISLTGFRPRV